MKETNETSTWRRAAGSIALVVIVTAVAAYAWESTGSVAGTHAALFANPSVDLQLDGPRGVNGFITRDNIAPGDRFNGTLIIQTGNITVPGAALDLDLDFQLDTPPANARGIRAIQFRYGNDDLLSRTDGGRDLITEIDRNPLYGNSDGYVTLNELQAGINDLPTPNAKAAGGTPLFIEFDLDPAWTTQSIVLANFKIVFVLSDTLHGDLN